MKRWDRNEYRSEYHSYNNMKARCRNNGGKLSPEFRTFDDFMDVLGAKQAPGDTLDRINPSDPEYGPGKVRWASKKVQSNNRRNVARLEYTGSRFPDYVGTALTISEWAEELGIKPATLRRRLRDGFSENEAIEGERASKPKTFQQMSRAELLHFKPWPHETREIDEQRFLEERNEDENENRFEFERRVLLGELRRENTAAFKRIASDYFGEDLSEEPADEVHMRWQVRDRRDLKEFHELGQQKIELSDLEAASMRTEKRWRAAVRRLNQHAHQASVAEELDMRMRHEDTED